MYSNTNWPIKLLPSNDTHHLFPDFTGQGESCGSPELGPAGRYSPPAGHGAARKETGKVGKQKYNLL